MLQVKLSPMIVFGGSGATPDDAANNAAQNFLLFIRAVCSKTPATVEQKL